MHGVRWAGGASAAGIDRFMSEARALTNIIGNAVATIVVARWEGELDLATAKSVLRGDRRAPAAAHVAESGEAEPPRTGM